MRTHAAMEVTNRQTGWLRKAPIRHGLVCCIALFAAESVLGSLCCLTFQEVLLRRPKRLRVRLQLSGQRTHHIQTNRLTHKAAQ